MTGAYLYSIGWTTRSYIRATMIATLRGMKLHILQYKWTALKRCCKLQRLIILRTPLLPPQEKPERVLNRLRNVALDIAHRAARFNFEIFMNI